MTDINNRINDLVTNFVSEITRLARAAAVETLNRALADTGAPSSSMRSVVTSDVPRPRRGRPPGATNNASATAKADRARSKGAKRPKSEIAEIQERVHTHIKANPGQRIEQINKVLGTRTSDLTLPLKKLIADGSIATKGARRATTYLPGDGSKKRGRRSK